MNKKFSIVIAVDSKNGIGKDGKLAWRLKKDMEYFRNTTVITESENTMNAVIMGRKTWESIPEKFRPLPGRVNCVLTRNIEYKAENAVVFGDLESCLETIAINPNISNIFIIGGAYLYSEVLNHPFLDKIYITRVEGDFGCDVFFKGIPEDFELEGQSEVQEEKGKKFRFQIYKKIV